MSVTYEEPVVTVTNGPTTESRETHPAYAQILCSRVSGGKYLYGSEFSHQHYITITLVASERHRNLSRDWFFGRKQIMEVSMSEAQWATFISTPNSGSGVPCTLEHIQGTAIPQIPKPKAQESTFKSELMKSLENALFNLSELQKEIQECSASVKTKKALFSLAEQAYMRLTDSVPWVAKKFSEHMEETTEKAKIEISAYMEGAIRQSGLKSISKEDAPKLLSQEDGPEYSDGPEFEGWEERNGC